MQYKNIAKKVFRTSASYSISETFFVMGFWVVSERTVVHMISQSQVDEVIERNDIGDVISEYVKLERKGSGYMGLCPFHNEKTPSFSVHEAKQIFKCFGCGKGGNVIHFIMLAEGLDYWAAVEFLANRAGIVLDKGKNAEYDKKTKLRQEIFSANQEAARYFYRQLKRGGPPLEYLRKRGITAETIKSFGLGYATEHWDGLLRHFTEQGTDPKLLLSAGLVLEKKDGRSCYDRFRNRVMFPIFDVLGNVIGFGGRVMDDSLPKYLNSPETPAYSKGNQLYGLNFARKSESRRVIIVEGYMDCIALHQKGITWAVASLGTALTKQQAKLLKKYFDEVMIGYDADSAGQAATLRGLDILAAQGFRVKVMSLADAGAREKDPDEYLRRHSAEEFLKIADRAKTLVEYKICRIAGDWPTDRLDTRAEFLKRATGVLAAVDSTVEQDMYIRWVSQTYEIPEEPLRDQVRRVQAGSTADPESVFGRRTGLNRVKTVVRNTAAADSGAERIRAPALSADEIKMDRLEKLFLLLLSEDTACLSRLRGELETYFTLERNKILWQKLLARADGNQKAGAESVLADAGPEDADLLSALVSGWITPPDSRKACEEVMGKIGRLKREMRISEIYTLLENPGSADQGKLMQELNALLQEKRAGS